MLADPHSITISGVTTPLPRTASGVNNGKFTSSDGTISVSAAHTYGRRTRRNYRVDFSKIAPDPLISDRNIVHSMSTYIVVDVPVTGFTVAEAKAVVDGFITTLTASSGSLITKLLGGES